jgi:hypothetical protein
MAAAAVNDLPAIATAAFDHLASERVDDERGLLWGEPGGKRYELSPWVALALTEVGTPNRRLDEFYAPVAPDPPAFAIEEIQTAERGLRISLRDAHGSATREIPVEDLNDMLLRAVEEIERDRGRPRPPRQDAHIAIALHSLRTATDDDATRRRCDDLARKLLDRVVAAQQDNGGWDYSAPQVSSVVYTAAGASATTFPDLQYTIDAAVPGIALCAGYEWLSDSRYLDSALAALRFFEETIGRLRWEGSRIWRLYPDDEKSARMGTAVNYELWNGAFFAQLAQMVGDASVGRRLSGYIDEILAYCEGHLSGDGAIAYGDYVREERLPYSAWDAYLLGSIGRATGREQATSMGRRILLRMEHQLLDSGALPNAWPYVAHGPAGDRWIVHRHGVGPYPIRAYYQLYPVVAAGTCGAGDRLALACFAFDWLQLREEVTGRMTRGYSGVGELDLKPGASVAASWTIDAIATLPRLGLPYAPRLEKRRGTATRWRELLAATDTAGGPAGANTVPWRPPPWLTQLDERLEAAEATGDEAARETALVTARREWLRHGDRKPDNDGSVADELGLEERLALAVALRRAATLGDDEVFDRYARTLLLGALTGNRDALGRWTESPGGPPVHQDVARTLATLLHRLGEPDDGWLTAP